MFKRKLFQSEQKIEFIEWIYLRQETGLDRRIHARTYRWAVGWAALIKFLLNIDPQALTFNKVVFWGWKAEVLRAKLDLPKSALVNEFSKDIVNVKAFKILAILSAKSCVSIFSVLYDLVLRFAVEKKFRNYKNKSWFFVTYEDTQPVTLGLLKHIKSIGDCTIVTVQHGLFNIKNASIEGMHSDACFVYNEFEANFLREAGFRRLIIIANPFCASQKKEIRNQKILIVGPGSASISELTKRRRNSLLKVFDCISSTCADYSVSYRPHPSEESPILDGHIDNRPVTDLILNPPRIAVGYNSTLLYELYFSGTKIINLNEINDDVGCEVLDRILCGNFYEFHGEQSLSQNAIEFRQKFIEFFDESGVKLS